MMHKHTRKLARIPDEVRTEIAPYFFECTAIADEGSPTKQQHSLFSQASWGRLEMKPERKKKFKVQAH